MREVAVTRSDALEKERSEKQAQEIVTKMNRTSEEDRLELKRLGLDETGVPDLE